ncbi:hypothetical protein EP47_13890 [Legionella norrlandica]|uniref:Periplasmic ligand-binding sensor domain protein n=1 Tax=Legionella norrlandica TaxID=1498499 RepID=A0A0A2SR54_9GAMM|nr:hypothetical protein [Legionella norrlandica]KGP62201.1 hypothetical protein EP47_13890 [Legionella norrlandica]
MQERREKSGGQLSNQTPSFTVYDLSNITFKTAIISFSVSTVTQPFNALLTRMQHSAGTPTGLNGGLFRGLYRGFIPAVIAGQQRGAVAVTHKQTNRGTEEEEIPMHQRYLGTLLFSQADLVVSNGLGSKAKLQNVGIITSENFKWSIPNWWKLTKVNWGSRSIAGIFNFAFLGIAGDYVSGFYKFDTPIYNKILGGATSGVIATMLTTIPNGYADKKLLTSKMENGHLLTTSTFTMFGKVKSHVQNIGIRQAVYSYVVGNYLKEVAARSIPTALTFGIIFGVDHLMGDEPLKRIWPGRKAADEVKPESSIQSPSSKM